MDERTYIAIDLKSFYASVECVERGLDPLTTNLVVADSSRTGKTICLAVSPSLKTYGTGGRPRLFQVMSRVREVNAQRLTRAPGHRFTGSSYDDTLLRKSPELELSYITAMPRMAFYIEYSTRIYNIYLKYIAPEDIHVYSIDEVFMDVTDYLATYKMTAHELAMTMIRDVLSTTGITATAGIGSNLYLCKIAMDIVAKHIPPDSDGVRIAELDADSYRRILWSHRPITDFWRVGRGYERKLAKAGMYTMGDVARCSLGGPSDFYNEDLLYKMFGVNAELLIDHAWGYEPCTISDIRAYKPGAKSVGSGQVLQSAYTNEKARIVCREMIDQLVLSLVAKNMVTDRVVLTVGYDIENLTNPEIRSRYKGKIREDAYGRMVPEHAHGTVNFGEHTSSSSEITEKVMDLFDRITLDYLLIRRINMSADNVMDRSVIEAEEKEEGVQLNLFEDIIPSEEEKEKKAEDSKKEQSMQEAMLKIREKFGKNSLVRGMDLEEGATTMERNDQIGGHKA